MLYRMRIKNNGRWKWYSRKKYEIPDEGWNDAVREIISGILPEEDCWFDDDGECIGVWIGHGDDPEMVRYAESEFVGYFVPVEERDE